MVGKGAEIWWPKIVVECDDGVGGSDDGVGGILVRTLFVVTKIISKIRKEKKEHKNKSGTLLIFKKSNESTD